MTKEDNLEWFFYVQEDFLAPDSTEKVNKYHLKYYEEFRYFRRNFNRKERTLYFFFYGEKNETVRRNLENFH